MDELEQLEVSSITYSFANREGVSVL
jgi:hypothetical protein